MPSKSPAGIAFCVDACSACGQDSCCCPAPQFPFLLKFSGYVPATVEGIPGPYYFADPGGASQADTDFQLYPMPKSIITKMIAVLHSAALPESDTTILLEVLKNGDPAFDLKLTFAMDGSTFVEKTATGKLKFAEGDRLDVRAKVVGDDAIDLQKFSITLIGKVSA